MRGSNHGFGTAPGADEPDPVGIAATGSSSDSSGGENAGPATAAEVQALIEGLSKLRLSASTDLSAAAGAMEDDRPEVAADLVAGTALDVARLRETVLRREKQESELQLVSAGVSDRARAAGGGTTDSDSTGSPQANAPRGRIPAPLRHPGRILAGVALLAITLLMAPKLDGDSGSGASGGGSASAAARSQSPQIRLVSAEFEALQTTLRSPNATPSAVLEAGKKWQRAVSQSLSAASTHLDTANQLVLLLRQERTLISDAGLQSPALSAATQTLAGGSDTLLDTLRGMADPPILKALPTAITVLPSQPSGGTTTATTTPTTGTSTPTPTTGGSASPAPEPTTGAPSTPTTTPTPTTPAEPTPPDQSTPAPTATPSTATPSPSASPSVPQTVLPQLQALISSGVGKATVAPSTSTGG